MLVLTKCPQYPLFPPPPTQRKQATISFITDDMKEISRGVDDDEDAASYQLVVGGINACQLRRGRVGIDPRGISPPLNS